MNHTSSVGRKFGSAVLDTWWTAAVSGLLGWNEAGLTNAPKNGRTR